MNVGRILTAVALLFAAMCFESKAQTNTQARLVIGANQVAPGDTVWTAVELTMNEGWHTYWRNGGDSGIGTKIEWTLPEGFSAGEIHWPVPEKYTSYGLVTYVYHGKTLLLVPLTVAADAKPGLVDLSAAVSWLECAELCVAGNTNLAGQVEIGSTTRLDEDSMSVIRQWMNEHVPRKEESLAISGRWAGPPEDDVRRVEVEWPAAEGMEEFEFFPYGADEFAVGGATKRQPGSGVMTKEVTNYGEAWPDELRGIVVARQSGEGEPMAYEVAIDLSGQTPSALSLAPDGEERAAGSPPGSSFLVMLLFGFLGGVILNIMPCVLPIIALKALGFVNQARADAAKVRQHGIIFGAGVLMSFLALAGLVIAVQAATGVASWGMQFGNRYFLVGMTALITLVALNLFGVFEINLGGRTMNAAGALASRGGKAGDFFNGVLATILATPCTAPFLGTALGFAFAAPPVTIVSVFLMIGVGLAAPYVLLSFFPQWVRFLPKPGPWMEKFKHAMGFPMLATAVWLFYITIGHFGEAGVIWLGLFLVALSLTMWIWGSFVQRGSTGRGIAMAAAAAVLIAAYVGFLEERLAWRSAKWAEPGKSLAAITDNEGIPWAPWSREAVAAARAEGKPVLVDFTAKWCLTCQRNKIAALEIPEVEEKIKEIGAVALLGDYTFFPPAITEELKKHNRAGVPLVLVYPADVDAPPIVLPEFLTPGIVLDALEKAADANPKVSKR